MLLCVAGLHGNEPAGVHALQRVISALEARPVPLVGDLVALAGNLTALTAGRRFLDEDLNRIWQPERVRALRGSESPQAGGGTLAEKAPSAEGPSGAAAGVEAREQAELLHAVDEALASARGPVYVLDLHTTSAESPPFVTLGDTLTNRALARQFTIPIILGLEEQLDGALLSYLDRRGLVGLGVEGGSHTCSQSVDALEAVLWIALVVHGHVQPSDVPGLDAYYELLRGATRHLPPVMEVRYRHEVRPNDDFAMDAGFENFQPVQEGAVVARDRTGPVLAPESGRMFLPLYQELGDDGYFIVRRVRTIWLQISAVLRRLGLAGIAPLLPGVDRLPTRDDALVLRPWAARDSVIGVLHLLGYRKRVRDHVVYMIRRKDKSGGYAG
jgi:succinylglutamate desuccinylase